MDSPSLETFSALEPALKEYIDQAIAARVDRILPELRKEMTRTLSQCQHHNASPVSNRATLVAFSGDMDKLMAAFIIATGAAAMGMEVSVYVTFWALTALKKKTCLKGKDFTEKLMGLMLPAGPLHLGTSKMNMWGAGPAFFRYVMKKKHVTSLADLIALAQESGVRITVCQMSMDLLGITRDELIDGLHVGGVSTYLADACEAKITLFI